MAMHGGMMGLMMQVAAVKGIDPSRVDSTDLLERKEVGEAMATVGKKSNSSPNDKNIDGRTVFRWLEEGDPAITLVYNGFIQTLAMLVFNLQMTLDPERTVIGGGVSRQPMLIPDICAEVEKIRAFLAPLAKTPEVHLAPCKFLAEANLVGAMYNYLLHFGPTP
jgi:predicted NBD/HSP70 family sugar kinase